MSSRVRRALSVRLVESEPTLISATGVPTGGAVDFRLLPVSVAAERLGGNGGSTGAAGGGWKAAEVSGTPPPVRDAPAGGTTGRVFAVSATAGAGGRFGGGGAGCICSGLGVARACGVSRRDSIGPGSGSSPCFRRPCPGSSRVLPVRRREEAAAPG